MRPGYDEGRDTGPVPPPPDPLAGASLQTRTIEAMLVRLVRGPVTADQLAAFKAALLAAPPAETIAAIREFLATGRNARTGQEFAIASGGGTLAGAPTLRLLLLDVLGQAARKLRSGDAAEVSRTILETKDSPDEWALALRNVAWADPQSRAYVASKLREMIAHEPWRAAPSDGLLEALDVAVWSRDATLVADLAAARDSNQAMSHAYITDRMAEAAPLEVPRISTRTRRRSPSARCCGRIILPGRPTNVAPRAGEPHLAVPVALDEKTAAPCAGHARELCLRHAADHAAGRG